MMLGREVHQLTDFVFKDTDTIRELVDLETYLEKMKHLRQPKVLQEDL